MLMVNDRRWAAALLLITPALWSVKYIMERLAPGLIALHMLALVRSALAELVLASFAWPELVTR